MWKYRSVVKLRYPEGKKDESKAEYSVTVPKKALKQLDWNVKNMRGQKSIRCIVDHNNRIILNPIREFNFIEEAAKSMQRRSRFFKHLVKVDKGSMRYAHAKEEWKKKQLDSLKVEEGELIREIKVQQKYLRTLRSVIKKKQQEAKKHSEEE